MQRQLKANVGDERFTVKVPGPTAWEAYTMLRDGESQAETINDALTTATRLVEGTNEVDDPELALRCLTAVWGTNKSETVREALRYAAGVVPGKLEYQCLECGAAYYGEGAALGCCGSDKVGGML